MFLLTASAFAQKESDKIAFLTFKYDGKKLTLIKTKLADGSFKEKKTEEKKFDPTQMRYEILNKKQRPIFSKYIDNPRLKNMEYADPMNPGQLRTKKVLVPDAEFTIRINYSDSVGYVRFYEFGRDMAKGPDSDLIMKVVAQIPIGDLKEQSAEKSDE